MSHSISNKQLRLCLLCGLLGCLFMGGSDWLMIYGDTSFTGSLAWLTQGVAQISPGRNALSLVLAFPAVVFYAVALFSVKHLLREERPQKIYSGLTAVGMTPWLCLHLFYIMILFLFGFLVRGGQEALAHQACEALFHQFVFLVPLGEAIILLPFLYLFYVTVTGKSVYPRAMALNNPLLIYVVLKVLTGFMPDVPARLAFVNGLMSESMFLWFLILMIALPKEKM